MTNTQTPKRQIRKFDDSINEYIMPPDLPSSANCQHEQYITKCTHKYVQTSEQRLIQEHEKDKYKGRKTQKRQVQNPNYNYWAATN